MQFVDVGLMYWPPVTGLSAVTEYTSFLIDAADEKAALILPAPKTGNIRKVHFATGTVTTGATLDVRIESVDATTGNPSGSLFGANTNISHAVSGTDDNVPLVTAALTADAAVTVGDMLAVVFVNPAGSPGNMVLTADSAIHAGNMPYGALYTTVWAKNVNCPRVFLEYSDGSTPRIFGIGGHYDNQGNAGAVSASTYYGNRITVPFDCRVVGFWYCSHNNVSAGVHYVKLFDSDGTTVLGSVAIDTDIKASNSGTGYMVRFPFASPVMLKAGENYWLAMVSDGISAIQNHYLKYGSSAIRQAFSNGGTYVVYASATNPSGPSSWVDVDTQVFEMGLLVDQVSVGGGLLLPPAMTGGFHRS